jgi:hypothetical protein
VTATGGLRRPQSYVRAGTGAIFFQAFASSKK